MSNRSRSDINAIGNVYGQMLNNFKKTLVIEAAKPKTKGIGDVKLQSGGPQEKSGFTKTKIDKKKKEKQPNAYNIDKLSNSTDEDEEFCEEIEKKAKARLNTFMIKKSVFDTLYESMLNDDQGGMDFDSMEQADADALIDDLGGEGGEEVTVEVGGIKLMLSRGDAEALKSSLEAQLEGETEGEFDDFEDEGEDEEYGDGMSDMPEEDEEEMGHPGVNAKKPDMGTKSGNKVGNVKPGSGGAAKSAPYKTDTTEFGHALHNAKKPDMGTNNKVGNLKPGTNLFK